MRKLLAVLALSFSCYAQVVNPGGGSGGGGGAVSSVFARTGAVVAATNDYSFSQISGLLVTGQLPATASFSSTNNVLWVDGFTYGSIGSAITALPSTGGTIMVPPNYSETMSSDIILTKPMVHIVFNGPATITMGAHVITTNAANAYPSISGFSVDGPVRGSNDAQVAGMPGFIYTGSGTAINLGTTATDIYGVNLQNFSIDITGAGAAAKALVLTQAHEYTIRGVNLHGLTSAGNTQRCIDSNGAGSGSNFNSYGSFENVFVLGCNVAIYMEGAGDANNANNFIGGSLQTNTTDGIGIYIADGDTNNSTNLDTHNNSIGVRFGPTAIKNVFKTMRAEANTIDVQFDSGATYNGVYAGANTPTVTDNSGVTNNWALRDNYRPTTTQSYVTSTASSGNITINLQPGGATALAGLYRVSLFIEVTVVATAGTYGGRVTFTDDAKAETLQCIPTGTAMTATGMTQCTAAVRSTGAANIQVQMNVTGITGTPTYTLLATLERLSP